MQRCYKYLPTPLSEHKVMCTAHGPFFTRLRYPLCLLCLEHCFSVFRPYKITRECNALWGKPGRAIEVCCRLFSTVEDGALSLTLGRMRAFSQYQDSVIGEKIEGYAVSCSFMQSPICYTFPNVANTEQGAQLG